MVRRHRIQQIADLSVSGDLMYTKEALRIVSTLALLHSSLPGQKGQTLQEEYRKGT